jgi:hypothetical protein
MTNGPILKDERIEGVAVNGSGYGPFPEGPILCAIPQRLVSYTFPNWKVELSSTLGETMPLYPTDFVGEGMKRW